MAYYGYIYKFTLIPTNLIYVGKRAKPEFDESYGGSGTKGAKAIESFKPKSKQDLIKREVIAGANNLDELNNLEVYGISKLNATDNSIGYNITVGGNGGSSSDCLGYNDGKSEFYIHKDSLDNLPSEYIPGRLFNHSVNKGHLWINNGIIQTHCLPDQAIEYINLDNSGEFGMLYRGDEGAINVTEHFRTEECAVKRNEAVRLFHKNNPDFRNDGMFKPGSKPHNSGKISITNGVTNRYISIDDDIPPGGWRGNTQKHHKKEKKC